jgi:hypothetical protein
MEYTKPTSQEVQAMLESVKRQYPEEFDTEWVRAFKDVYKMHGSLLVDLVNWKNVLFRCIPLKPNSKAGFLRRSIENEIRSLVHIANLKQQQKEIMSDHIKEQFAAKWEEEKDVDYNNKRSW